MPGYKAYMEEMVKRYEKRTLILKWKLFFRKVIICIRHFVRQRRQGIPDIQYMWGGTQAMEDVWKGNVAPISDYISEEELSVIQKSALAQTGGTKQWGIGIWIYIWDCL